LRVNKKRRGLAPLGGSRTACATRLAA